MNFISHVIGHRIRGERILAVRIRGRMMGLECRDDDLSDD